MPLTSHLPPTPGNSLKEFPANIHSAQVLLLASYTVYSLADFVFSLHVGIQEINAPQPY